MKFEKIHNNGLARIFQDIIGVRYQKPFSLIWRRYFSILFYAVLPWFPF